MLGILTYLLVAATLGIGVLRRPAIGLAAILTLYGLKQWGQSTTALFSEHRQITNILVGIIALIALALASFRRSCLFCKVPLTGVLVLAVYAYAFASILWGLDQSESLDRWVLAIPYIVIVTGIAPLLINDFPDAVTGFEWTALVGGFICALALVFGHWGSRGLILFDDNSDTETNPLALASMAGTVALIAGLSMRSHVKIAKRLVALLLIPVALGVIIRSGSRGQLFALAPALFAGWLIAYRPRDIRSVIAFLLAFGLVGVMGIVVWKMLTIDSARWASTQATEDVAGRLGAARSLLAISLSNPFTAMFGIGNSSSFKVIGYYPHVTVLEVLAEEGMVGLGIYCAALLAGASNLLRMLRRIGDDVGARHALSYVTAAFVYELILSWKQGALLSSVYVFAYVIILGRLDLLGMPAQARAHWQLMPAAPIKPFPNLMS